MSEWHCWRQITSDTFLWYYSDNDFYHTQLRFYWTFRHSACSWLVQYLIWFLSWWILTSLLIQILTGLAVKSFLDNSNWVIYLPWQQIKAFLMPPELLCWELESCRVAYRCPSSEKQWVCYLLIRLTKCGCTAWKISEPSHFVQVEWPKALWRVWPIRPQWHWQSCFWCCLLWGRGSSSELVSCSQTRTCAIKQNGGSDDSVLGSGYARRTRVPVTSCWMLTFTIQVALKNRFFHLHLGFICPASQIFPTVFVSCRAFPDY